MKPRFKKAAKVLILSHRHYCLISGSCSACAVGNLIFATQKLNCENVLQEQVRDKLTFKVNDHFEQVADLWAPGVYEDLPSRVMGYTYEQLDLIEAAFELRQYSSIKKDLSILAKTEYQWASDFLYDLYEHITKVLDIEDIKEHVHVFRSDFDDEILNFNGTIEEYLENVNDDIYDQYITPRLMCVLSTMHWFDFKKFPDKALIQEWLRLCDRTLITDEEVTTYFA